MYPEKVMAIVPNLNSGFFGQRSYTMIVTNYRLIFASITKDIIAQEQQKAQAQSQSSGRLGKWAAGFSGALNYHQRYINMAPEMILNESVGNYSVGPHQVKSIKLIPGYWDHERGEQTSNRMVLKWSGGKIKFTFDSMETNRVKEMLIPLLGNRVK